MWRDDMTGGRTRLLTAALAVAMLGGAAHWGRSSAQPVGSTGIEVKDFKFTPTPLTVKAGSTVTWTNRDEEPHTVVSDTGLFKSGGMDTNESFAYKFDKPGTYRFTCSIHPQMLGTIVVQ